MTLFLNFFETSTEVIQVQLVIEHYLNPGLVILMMWRKNKPLQTHS